MLTFSLSPMEKLLSSSDSEFVQYDTASAYSSPHPFLDNFCANAGWTLTNPILNIVQVEQNQSKENQAHNMADIHLTSLMNSQNQNQSVTETQDSPSLTQSKPISNQQDLKATSGFQAFSTNSGSEVDDSASIAKQQATPCEFGSSDHSVESSRNELALISSSSNGTSSLNAVTVQSSHKAVAAVDSNGLKKIGDSFGQRTSIFRGVTRHRWTGRYEAHLWDNSCRREGQARKGRQVYLGGYDKEEKAARAYDLAALRYWGPTATTNYPVSNYSKELEEMKHAGKQEFIAALRRKSSGFSRGASIYRGVTRHHQQGRWQARIGRVAGNKDLYLGTFATEEEAAEAYDIAAIKFRGAKAVTNFEMSRYDVEAILKNSLPVGGVAKRLKLSLESENKAPMTMSDSQQPQCTNLSSSINFSTIQPVASIPFDSETAYCHHNLFQHFQPTNIATEESAATISNAMTLPPAAEIFIWPHQSY